MPKETCKPEFALALFCPNFAYLQMLALFRSGRTQPPVRGESSVQPIATHTQSCAELRVPKESIKLPLIDMQQLENLVRTDNMFVVVPEGLVVVSKNQPKISSLLVGSKYQYVDAVAAEAAAHQIFGKGVDTLTAGQQATVCTQLQAQKNIPLRLIKFKALSQEGLQHLLDNNYLVCDAEQQQQILTIIPTLRSEAK